MGDSCKDKIYILKELTTFKTDYMNLAIAYSTVKPEIFVCH